MLAAVLAVALSQWGPEPSPGMQQYDPGSVCQRTGGRCFLNRSGNRPRENYAFFEFAPASGAGMGTACACTTPTGAKGETMTYVRAGSATCSKQGLATTGITNGDLVVCTANQPRVESSGGVLGLRVEGSRTNVLTRSSELDNAAWTLDFAGGGVIPTRTANAATAPDGTTSAERLQFSSCPTSGDSSSIYQLHATSGASASTVYCRGNASTQNISICSFGSGGSSGCSSVSCPSTSWSRVQDLRTATGTGGIVIGCNNSASYAGASNTGAADVFLWQAQQEMGATYATSPIPTVAAAVTRNQESPSFTLGSAVGPSASIAASVQWPSTAVGAVNYLALGNVGDNMTLYRTNDTGAGYQIVATITAPAVASMGTTVHRAALADASGTRSAFWDLGSVAAPAASMAASVSTVWIGRNVGGTNADGIVTRVCVDPDPTRCR